MLTNLRLAFALISEMRLYPAKGIASVMMVNSTVFNSTKFLNRVDRKFLGEN
jgi:hypothetical protein